MWRFRTPGPDEAYRVAALLRAVLPEPLLPCTIYGQDGFARFVADQMRTTGSQRRYVLLVEAASGLPAGIAEWRRMEGDVFLNQIGVVPTHRGRGGGRALLREGLPPNASGRLQLDVFARNTLAARWYYRLGLLRTGAYGWYELPPFTASRALARSGELGNAGEAARAHTRYGFSEWQLRTPSGAYTVGRLGRAWLRLTEPEVLDDPAACAFLAARAPDRRVLYLGTEAPAPAAAVLARSLRLEAPLTRVVARLNAPVPSR